MIELIILGFLFIFIGLNLYFFSKYKLSKLEERQKELHKSFINAEKTNAR
jgi:uncharacterized membrane protein